MKCPRCGQRARVEESFGESVLHCFICGNYQPMVVHKDGATIYHASTPEVAKLNFPKRGTMLSKSLGALATLGRASTGEVADHTRQCNNDTSSQLTVLRGRGLVVLISNNKGKEGGSLWELTEISKQHFGIKE